jgi:multiple sugar transport system substrate-binding protein
VTVPLLLAGCGFAPQQSAPSTPGSKTLTFTTWGTDAELASFARAIAAFEQSNPGSKVSLNSVPYGQMFTNIDAQLQAGNPPDIFRVPYYTFGSYAGRDQLLDLSPFLESGFADQFTDAAWAAVQGKDKPFGVPHHTDTSAILYNKSALDSAGITSVPTSLDNAWTWDELSKVAATLRASQPADSYPMAYNWQGNGVTRWLSLLFQADGRFLSKNLVEPAIDSPAGSAALDFSRSFFTQNFVPPNDTIKSATYASDTWYSQTSAMVWSGAFAIPDATKTLDFEWGATFAPRNERGGGDFGGNALVATANTTNPELAAAFLAFVTESAQMRDFCQTASLLPTRKDLTESGIDFDVRPELAPIFLGQASTVRAEDSSQVASPDMSKIITVLQDNLESAFAGSTSTADTLKAVAAGISEATGGS